MMRYLIVSICAFGMLASCAPEQLQPADYRAYVDDPSHGLRVSKAMPKHTFELHYRPAPYVALKELRGAQTPDTTWLNERTSKLKNLQHFVFRVKCSPGEDLLKGHLTEEQDYYNRIDYYHSYMPDDLRLIDGQDTLAPALFHYDRAYDIGPYHTFVLAFPVAEGSESSDKELIWNAWTLGYGPVHLRVKGSAIEQLPQLYL